MLAGRVSTAAPTLSPFFAHPPVSTLLCPPSCVCLADWQELAEYKQESTELKNQDFTIRKMEERARELEAQLEERDRQLAEQQKSAEAEMQERLVL